MKRRFLLLILVSSLTSNMAIIFAEDTPKGSTYDIRMQKVPYNVEDVTKINARLGFVTTIIFDNDEIVEKAISGFDAGWSITPYQNKLFISPAPVEQEYSESDEETDSEIKRFEPIAKDWKTNLFVSTTKRNYSMDLNLVDDVTSNKNYAHVVRYSYPEKDEAYRGKQELANNLARDKYPRNWDYFVKTGKGSENIVPDFAYDDGRLTYLGFGEGKDFPSVFLLNNGKEQIINYSVEQKGNYKVMVIHKLNNTFVLRYGTGVVGILNKSFGKYVKPYSSTNSSYVSREEQVDD